ncbi:MAG: flavodoxin family protein [Bacillota bacterium]
MNIVIINGSPRKNGATGKILKEIESYLSSKEDVTVKLFNLVEYDIEFCKGCMLCYKTGRCIITNDGIDTLVQELQQSDAVVLGSPTYGSNVSGQFKTLIDRGGFVFGQLLYGKYGFTVSTYENAAGNEAVKVMERLILFSGASRRGKYLLKLNHNTNPFEDLRNINSLHKKVDNFYNAVRNHKGKTIIEWIIHQIVINIGLKPRILKYKDRYAGIINRWEKINLI